MNNISQKLKETFFLIILLFITIGIVILALEITFPKMTTITVTEKNRVYPPKNCRKNINKEQLYNKAKKLADCNEKEQNCDFNDYSQYYYKEMLENEYYKQCVPQPNSYCDFDYHSENVDYYSFDDDVQYYAYIFNPNSYYVTCYQEKIVNKKVRVPLLQRIKETKWIPDILQTTRSF